MTKITLQLPPGLSDVEIDRLDELAIQAFEAGYLAGRADGADLVLAAVAARSAEIAAAALEAERGKPRLRRVIRENGQIVAIES